MIMYHINPKTGVPAVCNAKNRRCPIGGEHFKDPHDARRKIEKELSSNFGNTMTLSKKNNTSSKNISDNHSKSLQGSKRMINNDSLKIHNSSDRELIEEQQINKYKRNHYIAAMREKANNIPKYYPVGSLVEIATKNHPNIEMSAEGKRVFRRWHNENKPMPRGIKIKGRIVESNDTNFVVIDSETGQRYEFGKDEQTEREIINYDIKFVTNGSNN